MSSWIPFPWGKTKKSEEEAIDIESFVDSLKVSQDGFIEEEGITYIKAIDLVAENAVDDTIREFKQGNIVILDIRKILRNSTELYKKIRSIKKYAISNGGDVCRVSEAKLMVLPEGIEIAYKASSPEPEED